MKSFIKILFVVIIVKPVVLFLLGLNIVGRENLPKKGPAIVVANHNSHLDTMVLFSLFPLSSIMKVRPVAAADYFLKNKFISFLSKYFIDIIPIARQNTTAHKNALFDECHKALDNGQILIIFPEGSRGEPEKISQIKKGVYHLVEQRSDTKITPVVMHGLGKALPKGEFLLVPFNCDVVIGPSVESSENANHFVENLTIRFNQLFDYCITRSKQ